MVQRAVARCYNNSIMRSAAIMAVLAGAAALPSASPMPPLATLHQAGVLDLTTIIGATHW
jgi:hypothetical protein